jgi:hypothetical protein
MPYKVAIRTESLKNYPALDHQPALSGKDSLRFGDLHANPLYFIHLLTAAGFISISEENYHKLVDLYFCEDEDVDFVQENTFIELMTQAIDFQYVGKSIVLNGDIFFDRGRFSDDVMRHLIELIYKSGNLTILVSSNHDHACFDYFFADNIPLKSAGKVHQTLGERQARSGFRLIKKIEENPALKQTFTHFLKTIVFPHMRLSDLTLEGDAMVGGSHAITGFETHIAAAKKLGVSIPEEGTPQAFIRMIDQINEAYRKNHLLIDHPNILPTDEHIALAEKCGEGLPIEMPLIRYSHNRAERSIEIYDGVIRAKKLFRFDPDIFIQACLDEVGFKRGSTDYLAIETTSGKKWKESWKQINYTHTHGHEGPMLTPEEDQEVRGHGYKAVITENPFQSFISEIEEPTSFQSYTRVNLDQLLGREGSLTCNGSLFPEKDLTPFIAFHVGPCDTALDFSKKPNADEESRFFRLQAKHQILTTVIPKYMEYLSQQIALLESSNGDAQSITTLRTYFSKIIRSKRELEKINLPINKSFAEYEETIEDLEALHDLSFQALNNIAKEIGKNPESTSSEELFMTQFITYPKHKVNAIAEAPKHQWAERIKAEFIQGQRPTEATSLVNTTSSPALFSGKKTTAESISTLPCQPEQ